MGISKSENIIPLAMQTKYGNWVYIDVCENNKSEICFYYGSGHLVINRKEAESIIRDLRNCIKGLKG